MKNIDICSLLSRRGITGPNSNSMQYVEVEILEIVTLPMLPATSVKNVPRKMDESEESATLIKLGDTRRN